MVGFYIDILIYIVLGSIFFIKEEDLLKEGVNLLLDEEERVRKICIR